MAKRNIVVIGTSAGGIETLTELLGRLPSEFPASVFVVQHMSATAEGALAEILARRSALRVTQARDGERFEPGVVYTARPDHHLLLIDGHLSVARGPK